MYTHEALAVGIMLVDNSSKYKGQRILTVIRGDASSSYIYAKPNCSMIKGVITFDENLDYILINKSDVHIDNFRTYKTGYSIKMAKADTVDWVKSANGARVLKLVSQP